MIFRKYKDFDDMFLRFNREILTNTGDILCARNGFLGYMDNMTLACKSWDCNLNLGTFGYKKAKWGHLLKTYIDYDKLVEFREKLRTCKGLSFTFYFNQKQINNGSCLIAIVMSRGVRRGPWERVHVLYRTTEVQRRMAADLVMIHVFIRELPQELLDIKGIIFHMCQAYISGMVINGYLEYFGVSMDELSDHPWVQVMLNNRNKYFYEGAPISTYQSQARMQKLALGMLDCPPIYPKDLSIDEFFIKRKEKENKNGGNKGK